MSSGLRVDWLGRLPYAEALEIQQKAVEARRQGVAGDRLLLLEHPPVITLGRRADSRNLLRSEAELEQRGVAVHRVSRGGDVTYHGPGQLVGYLVLDLEARGEADVHRFLRRIEGALIAALAALGLEAERRIGMTGVFVAARPASPPRKIASIGVGLRGWVSYHGFALNLTLEPEDFGDIVPCGLHGVEMTSLHRELGEPPSEALLARSREAVAGAFLREFGGASAGGVAPPSET